MALDTLAPCRGRAAVAQAARTAADTAMGSLGGSAAAAADGRPDGGGCGLTLPAIRPGCTVPRPVSDSCAAQGAGGQPLCAANMCAVTVVPVV